MARGGYRTLLVADRELGREEYDQWQEAYSTASVSLGAQASALVFGGFTAQHANMTPTCSRDSFMAFWTLCWPLEELSCMCRD